MFKPSKTYKKSVGVVVGGGGVREVVVVAWGVEGENSVCGSAEEGGGREGREVDKGSGGREIGGLVVGSKDGGGGGGFGKDLNMGATELQK